MYQFFSGLINTLAYIALCLTIMFVLLMYLNNDLFIQILTEGPVSLFENRLNRQHRF